MFPFLAVLGVVGLVAYFSSKSTSTLSNNPGIGGPSIGTASAEKLLSTKQVLPAGTKLPGVMRAPDGELVFSTKQGGPSRANRQGNQRFPWMFTPSEGSSAKKFAQDFAGDESKYVELVGMPLLRYTGSKTHPSGIVEDMVVTEGILSPTEDGDGWILLRKGASAPEMWSPPSQSSPQARIITLPPSWRAGIGERATTAWDHPGFEVDAGLAPVFVT